MNHNDNSAAENEARRDSKGPPVDSVSAANSKLGRFWFTLRLIEVRLRFIAVLVAIGLIIGYWETLQNYWDRWTRPRTLVSQALASDTEFYCPMDPGVVRPGLEPNGSVPKCPICGMPLSLRKKGAPMKLPPGVTGRVSLTPERLRMAGVRTSEIGIRNLQRQIRSTGTVTYNQSTQSQIVTRISGYLEKLLVSQTYALVHQGDPLAEIYSPELYAAIQELKVANELQGSSLSSLAREKIRLLGIDDREIDSLLKSDETRYRMIIRSPSDGYVIKKNVQQGSSVSAGDVLFEVADLSTVWIEADVFERDIGLLREGQAIVATVDAYPDQVFAGRVSSIYPELQPATRTTRVRFEIDNRDRLLRAGMYATIELTTPLQETEPFHSILASLENSPPNPTSAIARQAVCPVTGAKLGSMGEPIAVSAKGKSIFLCCSGCTSAIEKQPDFYLARIQTVTPDGVLSVPESAVIDTGTQKIVYIQRETGDFEGVEVKLGPKSDGFYSVISGLLPGDKVAAAGAFLIDAETRLNPSASAAYFGASDSGARGGHSNHGSDAAPPQESGEISPRPLPPASGRDSGTASPDDSVTANLNQLSAEERELARDQVRCPVTELSLGSMGVPVRIWLEGQAVMLCCEGCVAGARNDAANVLAKLRSWKMDENSSGIRQR